MPTSLITQQEFWTLTDTEFSVDDFMNKYLIPASERARKWCDNDFGIRSITNEKRFAPVTLDQDLRVDFIVKPVVAVTSIYLVYGSSSSSLSLTNADLFRPEGYILIPFVNVSVCQSRITRASLGVGYLTLGDEYITESTYSGGAEVPLPVKEAVALLALEDYRIKSSQVETAPDPNMGVIKSYSIGRYSETYGATYEGETKLPGDLSWGTALGKKAEQILFYYRRKGVFILGVL